MKRLANEKKLARMEPWANWIRDIVDEITYPLLEEYHYLTQQQYQVDNPEKFLEMYELKRLAKFALIEANAKWMNGCREWDFKHGYGDSTFPRQKVQSFSYYVLIKKLTDYNQHFHWKLWSKFNPFFHGKLIKKYIEEFKNLPDQQSLDDFLDFCKTMNAQEFLEKKRE